MPTAYLRSKTQLYVVLAGAVLLEAVFARMHHLNDLKQNVIEFIVLALAAGLVYVVSLYFIEHSRDDRAAFWLLLAAAVLFRLTLFPLEPSLSDDLHRYRWDGHVQAEGWNPYEVAPNDPRLARLRDSHWAAMAGPETPSVYPPAAQLVFRLTWKLLPGPTAFKQPIFLADVLILAMLAGWFRCAGERNFRAAIYAWNPLVIVEFAGSGHNDVIALAGVVAGLLIIRRRPIVSTILLTAAALAKVFPAVLLPLWLRKANWPRSRQGWVCALAGVATAAACIAPYWRALGKLQANLAYYEATWRNYHASLYTMIDWFTGKPEIAAGLGVGIVWGLALWLGARRADSVRAAYLLFGAILLLAPNGYPWYFTWMVPLLCFFPNPAWLLLTVLQFLSYNVLIEYGINWRWHFDPFLQWLTYGPFYALLIAQAIWPKWREIKT